MPRRRLNKEYNLRTEYPEIAKQWHPTKNGSLTPDNIFPHSSKKVWWICKKGHEWEAIIQSRQIAGCPFCRYKKLSTVNPDLAKEWHPTKNGTLNPDNVPANSAKKVWWICKKGHEWAARVFSRNHGSKCPFCSVKRASQNTSLKALNPELAKQWHPTKNGTLTPNDVLPGSKKKVWWICKRGHEWQALVQKRNQKGICPFCSNRKVCEDNNLAFLRPDLAKEWHPSKNGKLSPKDIVPGSNKLIWWICPNKHVWQSHVMQRHLWNLNCRRCKNLKRIKLLS